MVSGNLTVLQVLPALQAGGVERGTLEVGKYLVSQGHRSIVISAGGRMVDQLVREGSEHFSWPIGDKSLWTLRLIWRLRRFLVEQQVDILHVRSRMPAWVCYLAWSGMDPTTRPKFVTTLHGFYSVNRYSAVMCRGERVIAVSDAISGYVRAHYPDLDMARIRVIHRGIDPALYFPEYQPETAWMARWQEDFPHLANKRLVVLPGRISRLKGHHEFISLIGRLSADLPDVHGLIVGDAAANHLGYRQELDATIRTMGLADQITFTGHRNDLREIFAVSDLVLSLSAKAESFGRTVLEALALGTPVVAYARGGVGEILDRMFPPGKVAPDHADPLYHQCKKILENAVTPGPVPEEFTLRHMLQMTLQVYLELKSSTGTQ